MYTKSSVYFDVLLDYDTMGRLKKLKDPVGKMIKRKNVPRNCSSGFNLERPKAIYHLYACMYKRATMCQLIESLYICDIEKLFV